MALRASMIWEVQTGGNDTNGGGFDTSETTGTDRSQATSPHVTFDGTTVKWTIASAGLTIKIYGHTVSGADLGNVLNVTGGTNATAGRYSIDAVTTGSEGTQAWTVLGPGNISTGEVTDGAGRMGGCLATPGAAAAAMTISGHKTYVKTGEYTTSTATPGVAGPVSFGSALNVIMEGYNSARGDLGGTPTLKWGAAAPGSTAYLFTCVGNGQQQIINMTADCDTLVNVSGFYANNFRYFLALCHALDASDSGEYGFNCDANDARLFGCKATNCATGYYRNYGTTSYCEAYDCAGSGFDTCANADHCVAHGCGSNFYNSQPCNYNHCTSDASSAATAYGFEVTSTARLTNCLATNNTAGTAFGFYANAVSLMTLFKCAGYGNDTNVNTNVYSNTGFVTLTADPYATVGSDFTPNTTAGGGADVRAAAREFITQTCAADIGAVQHADPTVDYPDVGNVHEDDTVGGSAGTLTLPTEAQVEKDVQFGAGGTEFTGTLEASGGHRTAFQPMNGGLS